jgi:glutathione S-transferase
MLTLFHHPVCPHSLFVRLALREYGLSIRQVVEKVWERREEFLVLNPAGTTPVLVTEEQLPVPGASIIAEYLDEVYGKDLGDRRFLPPKAVERIEVRRLMYWFNDKFFVEVSGPLTAERQKQYMPLELGGTRDFELIGAASQDIPNHLAYMEGLLRKRDWLAGARLSYADLAAVAHLSAAEYFGELPWTEYKAANVWRERMQSRPTFQAVLNEGWKSFIRA